MLGCKHGCGHGNGPLEQKDVGKGGFDQPIIRGRVSWEEELSLVGQTC